MYKSLKDVNPSLLGIKPPISLAQANEIAAAADAMEKAKVKGSPWAFSIANFKKKYVAKGDAWVLREPEPEATKEADVAEAATYKAEALALVAAMKRLLANRSVPAALRKEVEDVQRALRRTWADLKADASGDKEPEEDAPAEDIASEDTATEEVAEDTADPNAALLARTFVTVSSGARVSLADCVAAYEARQGPVAEVAAKPKSNGKHKHEDAIITVPTPDKAREWATQLGVLLAEVMNYLKAEGTAAPLAEVAVEDTTAEDAEAEGVALEVPGDGSESTEGVSSPSDPTETTVPAVVAESIEYEGTSDKEVSLTEAALTDTSGHVIELAEASFGAWDGQGPLKLRTVLIEAGPGNARDKHYYPADMLQRCAPIFEGRKMYASDHKADEKSVRTEVADILKCPAGYTDRGGIVAEVGIFDPDFARKVYNRAQMGTLSNLAVSIVGAGRTRRGTVDGQSYDVVQEITDGAADFVTSAGAGGRALAIAEAASDAPNKQEGNKVLTKEQVQEALVALTGPEQVKVRLAEREYETVEAVGEALKGELAYIAEVTNAGKPVGIGETAKPPQPVRRTIEEHDAAVQRIINGALGR